MGESTWVATGLQGAQTLVYTLEGPLVIDSASHQSDTPDSNCAGHPVIRIGEGIPATVPCPVLPSGGRTLPVVTQDHPAGVLGGWSRLWIAGFLARREHWDGVICVAEGDVTHWVHVSAGEIISFSGFLTLRLITALGGANTPDPEAIADSQSRPERLAAHLRQAEVSGRPDAITGYLIGAELSAARVYWLGQQLALIAPDPDSSVHAAALTALEVPFSPHGTDDLTEEGLAALGRALELVSGKQPEG